MVDPCSVLEHAAVHATLATLCDVDTPLALFRRHAEAHPEFALIASLVEATPHASRDNIFSQLQRAGLSWREILVTAR